jgi:tetratricopeptide (TPR) repeat protein
VKPALPPPPSVQAKPAPVVEPKKPTVAAAQAAAPTKAAPANDDALSDFVLDLDEALGDDFSFDEAKNPKPATPQAAPPAAAASSAESAKGAAKSTAVTAVRKIFPPASGAPPADASSTLSDLFAEFKDEVEENENTAEDPDTHYNLGVAFKEMGLLDEAIGELQKVCHAIEKGHPFTQVMQAYTWLAHCFLEKGAPEASVKWYEKALRVPSIDEEAKLAVYYELGSAYEAAGNKRAALQNFNEVYSNNIDYRDVAERIKALKS